MGLYSQSLPYNLIGLVPGESLIAGYMNGFAQSMRIPHKAQKPFARSVLNVNVQREVPSPCTITGLPWRILSNICQLPFFPPLPWVWTVHSMYGKALQWLQENCFPGRPCLKCPRRLFYFSNKANTDFSWGYFLLS